MNQKGVIALAIPFLLLIIVAVVVFILISQGVIRLPSKLAPVLPGAKKEPTVSLQTQYQNPFDKNAQFVNPFSSYKNPFDLLK